MLHINPESLEDMAQENIENKSIEKPDKQNSGTTSSDDGDESMSSQAEDNEQEEMANATNSKSEAESHRAKEVSDTSLASSTSTSVSHSVNTSDSASVSAHIEEINRNDTVQQKRQPAPSRTASDAASRTAVVTKADEAKHNYNDGNDYNPQMDISKGYHELHEFTKEFGQDAMQHRLDQSENVNRLMGLLNKFVGHWKAALNQLWSSENKDIHDLQVQMKALKYAGSGMKGVDIKGQLGIILQWVRTGVPAKIDEDFQRIDKIANDPQFIAWAKRNHQNDELGIPKAMETTYNRVTEIKKRRDAAENKQANQKGNNK